jgi:hypothetical protein
MILNGYALLDAFLTLLRLLLAMFVIGLGISVWKGWRRAGNPEARKVVEDRGYLLFLLAWLLLFVNLASWPLLYLLLESYIPQWPGVMCIYGVTQVGKGSLGSSRFLPTLLETLQVLKPALVFASGAWGMLYLANRRAANSPLMSRALLVLIAVGALALADSTVEGAYLVIPKKEEFHSAGCCTAALDDTADRFVPTAIVGDTGLAWLPPAYYLVNAGMILGLFASIRRPASPLHRSVLALLLAGAVLALAVSGVFLIDVAAPTLLHLPHHHCPYDLIPRAPESVLAVVSLFAGTFAVGWACVTAWFAHCPETRPFLHEQVRSVLVIGLFGYLGSLVMLAIEMSLT